MMKQLIYTLALLLGSLGVQAQTAQPDLPAGALRYSQTLWIAPDSTLWTGKTGNYIRVADWHDVDSLFGLGYDKGQVDSAIAAQIGLINFPVTSVNGETGAIMLDANDIGLGNVDNTSDANKPISTAQQTALDGKENAFSKNTAFNKNFGISSGTVAQGNDIRILNGQTAYGWGDHDLAGYMKTTSVSGSQIGDYVLQKTSGSVDDIRTAVLYATTSHGLPNNGHVLSMRVTESTGAQIMSSVGGTWRVRNMSSGTWGAWYDLYHSGNLSTFTPSATGLVPASGSNDGTTFLANDGSWKVPSGGGGGTATNLSIGTRTATTMVMNSSSGSAATMPAATTSLAGLMSAADKVAVSNFNPNDYVPSTTSVFTGNHLTGGGQLNNDLTIKFVPLLNNWINDSGNSPRLYFGTGPMNNYAMRLNNSSGVFTFRDIDDNTVASVSATGIGSFASISLSGSASTVVRGDGSAGNVPYSSIPVGTTSNTVAQGNDIRILNGQTAYNWGNHAAQKYLSAKATTSTSMTADEYNGDLNDLYSGVGYAGGTATNKPGSGNGHVFTMRQSPTFASQLYAYASGDQWLVRKNQGGTWSNWFQLWHSGNLNPADYAQLGTGSAQVRNNTQLDARYLQSSDLSGYVPTSRTINGKALSANVTLTASDLSAMPTSWTISAGSGLTGGGSGAANRTLAVDATVVRTTGTQIVDGVKQFIDVVTVPMPSMNDQVANKEYVDTQIAAAVSGIVKVGTPFSTASPTSMPPAYIVYTNVSVPEAETSDNVIVNVTGNDWRAGMAVSACVNSTGVVGVSITNASSSSIATDGNLSFYISLIK